MTDAQTKEVNTNLPYKIQQIAQLSGHEERVWAVSWNPVRPLIASCSSDKTIRIYHYSSRSSTTSTDVSGDDVGGQDLVFNLSTSIPTGHTKTVRSVAWAPDGKTLAAGSFDANISIWEQEEGSEDDQGADMDDDDDGPSTNTRAGNPKGEWECAALLEGHETECKCVAYSSNGSLLASCSRDKTVWVWEVQPDSDFECMGVLMTHTQDVKHVSWHPTEELLASASYDDTIKLYADDPRITDDWDVVATLTGHTSTVWATAFSPDGRFLVSCSADKSVRIWRRVPQDKNGGGGTVLGIVGGGGGDPYNWECVSVLGGHDRAVYSISWGKGKTVNVDASGMDVDDKLESSGWLASTGGDGRINIWDIQASPDNTPHPKLVASLPDSHGVYDVNHISWCPRKGFEDVFATAGDDLVVRVWRIVPA